MLGKPRGNRKAWGTWWPVRRGAGVLAMMLVPGVVTASVAQPDVEQTEGQGRVVSVIVTGSSAKAAAHAVRSAGGTVTTDLPLIDGVAATLAADVRLPSAYSVVADRRVTFASETLAADPPVSTLRQTLGLESTGSEGGGVTVALVDTGVADAADLTGRLAHIDVTGSGPGDGYGHGTYLAGLIAGSGSASGGQYQGVAPQAQILDVKVAGASGETSLSMVLTGLQAVSDTSAQHGTDVINLSLASGSPLPYQVDPLNQALRALWNRGFTVVVASGNDGPAAGSVASPGNDPTLITVGAVDESYSASRLDDVVADFSGRGPTDQGIQKPDVVAPGTHVVGLRAPGSYVDAAYPQAHVGDAYLRGSGTSASAAVTSAAVAALLSVTPDLGPDQVKQLLIASAYRGGALSLSEGAGAGGLDLRAALALADSTKPGRRPIPPSPAAGKTTDQWNALRDAFARGDRLAATEAWDQLTPEARSWAARSWAALDPAARSWAARSWAARSWATAEVTSEEWAARSWAARSWAGEDWAARSWAARSWAARSWAGEDWVARSWAGDDWAARSWANGTWSARSWAITWR